MTKETIIFAGGCFWCTEAIFKSLKGVISVEPGYSGGEVPNPTYEKVYYGNTGHAEAVKIEYDSEIISTLDLLSVFFNTHDPTSLNQQGADVGVEYRSAIFYTTLEQKSQSEEVIKELNESGSYDRPVVTEVRPFKNFYPAENYHKNYYEMHKDAPYCEIVIAPKLEKLQERFKNLIIN